MRNKLIFLSLFLIIIGVVGCIFTFNTSNKMTEVNQDKIIDGNINAITIDTVTVDVEIIATKEQQDAHVELTGNTDEKNIPQLSVKNVDGHLKIEVEETKNQSLNFNVNFTPRTLTLNVYVPKTLIDTIAFNSVSADISLENVVANQMKLTTTSGDMNGIGIQASSTSIKTVSGDTDFENITGAYEIKTTSGDVYLHVTELIHPIKVDSVSGDVEIETSKTPTDIKFNIKTISGDVNIFDEYSSGTVIGQGTTLVDINTKSADILVDTY